MRQHLHGPHKVPAGKEYFEMARQEEHRVRRTGLASRDIKELEDRFPKVALLFVEDSIPVYDRVSPKEVRQLTVSQVPLASTPRRAEEMSTPAETQAVSPLPSSSSPPVLEEEAVSTLPPASPPVVDVTLVSSVTSPMSSTLRRSPRVPVKRVAVSPDSSADSNAVRQPKKKARKALESDDDATDETVHVHGSRALFRARYQRVGMGVTLAERDHLITHPYIRKLELSMRSMNPNVEKSKRKDSELNSLAKAMKIMKFCAPDNDPPQRFHWSHMTREKLNLMSIALNNDVELKPNNIANFWKTANNIVREGKFENNLDDETLRRLTFAEMRLKELSAANSKHIARGAIEQRAEEVYHLTEDQYYLTMETFEKVRTMCRPVFDNARVKKPTDRELALVNNMFAFYNMIQGNRSIVFQNVCLDRIKKATDRGSVHRDGKRYYYLSCAAQDETGSWYVACMYIQDIIWDDLLTYVKHLRPRPSAPEYENILFLNSLGRSVLNPSDDLARFLPVVEPRLKGSTNTRKLLTALSHGGDQALPHKAGFPILSALLEKAQVEKLFLRCSRIR